MKVSIPALLLILSFSSYCQQSVKIYSLFSYSVSIPAWLKIRETGDNNSFGGTLPAINGIENAILITGFPKAKFKDFEDFKEIYLTGNRFGQPTKYSNDHIWYGQKELELLSNGVQQKIFIFWRNKIYHDKFVLLETSKSFLWIQFIATPETYDTDIGKFEDFILGLITN